MDCLASPDLADANESTMNSIAKDGALNVRELELFDAVVLWAKRQCTQRDLEVNGTNMRQVITNIVHLINYFLTFFNYNSGAEGNHT